MKDWMKKERRVKNILNEKAKQCDQHKTKFKQDCLIL